jgi:hypothetical protein
MNGTLSMFSTVKRVTETLFKMELDVRYYLRIDERVFLAKANVKRASEGAPVKQPPVLARVTVISEAGGKLYGNRYQIIVPTVMLKELEDSYADHAYVGKVFCVIRHRLEGRTYNTFEITEVAVNVPIIEEEGARPHMGTDVLDGDEAVNHDPETGEITEQPTDMQLGHELEGTAPAEADEPKHSSKRSRKHADAHAE